MTEAKINAPKIAIMMPTRMRKVIDSGAEAEIAQISASDDEFGKTAWETLKV